mgnify:CR=1 FL=1
MTDMTPAPRRPSRWRLFIAPVLLLIAAVGWSAFWFYAASEVGVRAAQEAFGAEQAEAILGVHWSSRVANCDGRTP